jgi:hypothetical protein
MSLISWLANWSNGEGADEVVELRVVADAVEVEVELVELEVVDEVESLSWADSSEASVSLLN